MIVARTFHQQVANLIVKKLQGTHPLSNYFGVGAEASGFIWMCRQGFSTNILSAQLTCDMHIVPGCAVPKWQALIQHWSKQQSQSFIKKSKQCKRVEREFNIFTWTHTNRLAFQSLGIKVGNVAPQSAHTNMQMSDSVAPVIYLHGEMTQSGLKACVPTSQRGTC